jgi:GxxExxY protein
MINGHYKYSELTEKIIGCAVEFHRQIGNGFQKVIYQRALEIEMKLQGLAFSREHEMEIFYKLMLRKMSFL